jgi:methylenetetrahydrofolate reductase (NADPH)
MHHTHSPTAFKRAVQAGEFLVTAEVAPPKGGDPAHMIQMAATLKGEFMPSMLLMVAAPCYGCLR